MRITGGRARGIRLKTPSGSRTRPAADAMREALFSSLGDRMQGCRFVDLFAGTGSYGLEAFSRGAEEGVFVETSKQSLDCIRENLDRVAKSANGDPEPFRIIKADVLHWRPGNLPGVDVVFADPPYAMFAEMVVPLFDLAGELLNEEGLLVLEHSADSRLNPDGWILIKRFGKSKGQGPAVGLWSKS